MLADFQWDPFNSKHSPNEGYIMCQFEENQTKSNVVRVPQGFYTKWPP